VPLCGSHAELWIGWLNGGLCASDVRVLYSAAGATGSLIRLRGVSINLISFFSKGVGYSTFPLIRSFFGGWSHGDEWPFFRELTAPINGRRL
jgi:hypothetical protein